MQVKELIRSLLRKAGIKRPEADTYSDFSDQERALIARVRPFTMTSRERIVTLRSAISYLVANGIQGDIVECGVWRGGSMMVAAATLKELGDESRELYLFDTFEGMPPPRDIDKCYDGRSAQDILDSQPKNAANYYWAMASLEDVRTNVSSIGYPEEKIHYVQGKVEDTIPAVCPGKIALLRLDTDWYESTRHELIHLLPNLVQNGILILDDYGWYQGARKAVDEYFASQPFKPLLHRIDRTGRTVVKSW